MKTFLFIPCMLLFVFASAQTVSKKIALTKGQKLEQQSQVKVNITSEMGGQSMENLVESNITSVVEIKDVQPKTYEIANTLSRVIMNMTTMGQEMKFDSDKKEDMEGEMGGPFKDKIGKPREFTIDKQGIITELKTKSDKKDDAGGMMNSMMSGVMGDGEEVVGSSFTAVANIPVKGVKVGDSWTDSTTDENGKTSTTYTLKEVSGDSARVTLTSNFAISRELEQQGMTMQMNMTGTITGEYTFEVPTGIIKSRKATTKTTGTIDVMGQAVPLTMESTMVNTVTKK